MHIDCPTATKQINSNLMRTFHREILITIKTAKQKKKKNFLTLKIQNKNTFFINSVFFTLYMGNCYHLKVVAEVSVGYFAKFNIVFQLLLFLLLSPFNTTISEKHISTTIISSRLSLLLK